MTINLTPEQERLLQAVLSRADDVPEVALRFREAVRRTVQSLRNHPQVGP